jgi:hypothetical protein
MNFLKTSAAGAAVLTMVGTAASAATFTFGADAIEFQTSQGFEGTFDQVYNMDDGDNPTFGDNTQDGITVNATASIHPPNDDQLTADPFMDSLSGNKPAGLGVCSTGFDVLGTDGDSGDYGGISRCSTQYSGSPKDAGDDNLLFPEILTLTFSKDVWLQDLMIRDADHNLVTGSILVGSDALDPIELEGGGFHPGLVELDVIAGVVQDTYAAGFSSLFYFTSAGGRPGDEIYLEVLTADVPLPAAGWLLLGGLGGLAAMKRRKKAA